MCECPASFIRAESLELIHHINAADHIKDATGAAFFGTDSSRWDCRYFDAVRLVRIEDIKIQNAEYEATRR